MYKDFSFYPVACPGTGPSVPLVTDGPFGIIRNVSLYDVQFPIRA